MHVPDAERAMSARFSIVSMRTDGSSWTSRQLRKHDRGDRPSDRAGRLGWFDKEQMKAELFYIAECANYREAARMLRKALCECGISEEVSELAVTDSAQGEDL